MSGYLLSPEAHSDVFEIWAWIAKDSVELADRVDGKTSRKDLFFSFRSIRT